MPNSSILHQNIPKMQTFEDDASRPQVNFAVDGVRRIKEAGRNAVPLQKREHRLGKGAGGVLERIVVLDAPAAGLRGAWVYPNSWTNRRAKQKQEIPRLCRGGSRSLTFPGVFREVATDLYPWWQMGCVE
jgi:hypothetical protein